VRGVRGRNPEGAGRLPRAGVARSRLRPDPGRVDDSGVVTLMTLHTAKGWSCGLPHWAGGRRLPHMRSLGDARELEEERRWPTSASPAPGTAVPVPGGDASAWGLRSGTLPRAFLEEIRPSCGLRARTPARRPGTAMAGVRAPTTARRATGSSSPWPRVTASRTTPSGSARGVHRGAADKAEATIDFGTGRQAAAAALRPGREALTQPHCSCHMTTGGGHVGADGRLPLGTTTRPRRWSCGRGRLEADAVAAQPGDGRCRCRRQVTSYAGGRRSSSRCIPRTDESRYSGSARPARCRYQGCDRA